MTDPAAALVRPVSPRLAEAELTHVERVPIDTDRARAQHDGYRQALAAAGLEVVMAPPLPGHPDGVFVEDAVVVVDDLAVLTRPGAASRRDEPATLAATLAARGYQLARIAGPGHLDGGDVLAVDDVLYVGVSTRTDAAGAAELGALVAARGRRVVTVPVPGALHLKTAVTALPDGILVGVRGWVDAAAFGDRPWLEVPEPAGANLLLVGAQVLVSASAPATAALLTDRGWAVTTVAIDELEKAEAGLTCMSVLLPR